MSKILCKFKVKDLYAIKHALEREIDRKISICDQKSSKIIKECSFENEEYKQVKKLTQDIEHEKEIVKYIVEEINMTLGNCTEVKIKED